MQFDYFYGSQAEQFSFYRIPKVLFTDPQFKPLSTDAKVLYGIQKACRLMLELEKDASLIERKRQGLGKPSLIYVKNFAVSS